MTIHLISTALVIRSGAGGGAGPYAVDPSEAARDPSSGPYFEQDSGPDLDYWWTLLQPAFSELILVSPEPRRHLVWPGLIVQAAYRPQAPLAAVQAALSVAQNPQLLVVDPYWSFLSSAMITKLAAIAEERWDVLAVEPQTGQAIIPMVFHKRCLKNIDHHLTTATGDPQGFYRHVRVHTLALNELII